MSQKELFKKVQEMAKELRQQDKNLSQQEAVKKAWAIIKKGAL